MKIHRFTLLTALLTSPAFAQTILIADYLQLQSQNSSGEGGELELLGSNGTGSFRLDNFFGHARIHTLAPGKQFQVLGGSIYADGQGGTNFFASNVGIGTSSPTGKLHIAGAFSDGIFQDTQDRPSVGLTGLYPQAVLMAVGTGNPNHGPTVMLGSFDSGSSGAHKHWSIGTPGQNSTFLDIGYHAGTDLNPHAGIRNYNGRTIMTLLNSGNVGIGTTNPSEKLHVKSATATTAVFESADNHSYIVLKNAAGSSSISSSFDTLYVGDGVTHGIHFRTAPDWGVRMTIQPSGNVGIGTTNPTHKLAVNGTIKAKEVIVETTGWSDYVFADDYALQPLAQVEAHVKEHKHLPGIPSASAVATNGVNVGAMQAALLAKVEELTLHLIAQEKELSRLRETEKDIASLRAEVRQLRQTK